MLRYLLILTFIIPVTCFSNHHDADDEYTKQLEAKIDLARRNIYAAETLISRIQSVIHSDPDKAQDLCITVLKYLWNTDQVLNIHPSHLD